MSKKNKKNNIGAFEVPEIENPYPENSVNSNNSDQLREAVNEELRKETQENMTDEEKRTENLKFNFNSLNYKDDFNDSVSHTDNTLDFLLPQYGVQDFINERANWQKGVHNLTGEPGWFYFKIFFNFTDIKGLFGGLFDDTIPNTSAIRYLYGIRDFYKYDKIYDRILALARFAYTLSYINSVTPWFFIGINGLNKLNRIQTTEFGKSESIDLLCNTESIDMRLNTLLDMYKYACYDEINCKEIIPANLRKFDMSIVIMNVPIKYFQTGMLVSGQDSTMSQVGKNGSTLLNKAISGINKVTSFMNGSSGDFFDYKTVGGKDNSLENRLSFQMYTLKNCEIDPISFENYTPNSMNNSQFSKFGNSAIKINYDRSYKHTFNEWNQMMFGSDGIYYDGGISQLGQNKGNLLKAFVDSKKDDYNASPETINAQAKRISAIKKSIYNSFFNKDTDTYKALIDFSESVIEDSLINNTDPEFLGNIGMNYNENDYEDMWNKTKDKVNNFFTKPFKF